MRLLDTHTLAFVNNESRLRCDEHGNRQWGYALSYAILSHTWEEGEITFDQIQRDASKLQTSKKILGACEQARRDGEGYIWIDSCCIDNSSSAELSEAINSMFTWYQKSSRCYIYLCDVQTEDLELLAGSRYFTRSWTLQEMIAPDDFELFDCDWQSIGTLEDLREQMSKITGIDHLAFGNSDLSSFSIALRMSWAADREATKPEDIAYSLLGLFGVNMPLLYGEGATKAFRRLQREIMKSSVDQSILAWSFKPNAFIEDSAHRSPGTSSWLLAPNPSKFRNSKNIFQGSGYEYAWSDSSLEAQWPTRRYKHGTFLAILTCFCVIANQRHFVGMFVNTPIGHNRWSIRQHAGSVTTIVPDTWFFRTHLTTITLQPLVRIKNRPEIERHYTSHAEDQYYLEILYDEKTHELQHLLPEDRYMLVDESSKSATSGRIFSATFMHLVWTELIFRCQKDNTLLTVALSIGEHPSWHKVLEVYQGARNNGHVWRLSDARVGNDNVLDVVNDDARKVIRHRVTTGNNLETVATWSESQWLNKAFYQLKVAEFERNSDNGWFNRANILEYPWNGGES